MAEPMFRPLSKKEMDALSLEEHIEYVKQLIEHVNGQIEDTNKSIGEREKLLKNSETGVVHPGTPTA